MEQKHYQVKIDNHKIAYALYLNDILIGTNRFHKACHNEFPVSQYVVNGDNSLRLNLSINPHWTEAPGEQWCNINVTQYRGVKGSLNPAIISTIDWKWNSDTLFPVNLYNLFQIDIPYGDWTWLNADTINEENINLDSLKNYLTNLHLLISNKNYGSLKPFLEAKSRELSKAFYIPYAERLADQENFFKNELFSSDNWELEPLNFNELMFDFHAKNRLVRILKRNGKSPITSKPIGDNIFELELFLCHKNNQWILCR